MRPARHLEAYADLLTAVFPDAKVRIAPPRPQRTARPVAVAADAELTLAVRGFAAALRVTVKRTHLATAVAQALVAALGPDAPEWVLFAPYVGRPLAALLAAHGLNYLDLQGNCRLRIGGRLAAHVEGRRPQRRLDRPKGVRAAGARALLALAADPDLLHRTGREIARAAGTTHPTALDAVRRLEEAGAVATEGRERRWTPKGRRIALERWLDEYETVLRPAIVVGRYRTPARAPTELDAQIARVAATDGGVRLGGAAAAFRIAPHHRGETTVVHADGDPRRVLRVLRAVPDADGPLVVMGMPGPGAARGATPDTVHPVLVYAEMLHAPDDRTLEAAEAFRKRALGAYA